MVCLAFILIGVGVILIVAGIVMRVLFYLSGKYPNLLEF